MKQAIILLLFILLCRLSIGSNNTDYSIFLTKGIISEEDIALSLYTIEKMHHSFGHTYEEDITKLSHMVYSDETINNITFMLYLPKCLAESPDDLVIETKGFKMLNEGSTLTWNFIDFSGREFFIYETKGNISQECIDEINFISLSEGNFINNPYKKELYNENRSIKPIAAATLLFILIGTLFFAYNFFRKHFHYRNEN